MENAFNIPELEKKPLTQVVRPGQGLLSRVRRMHLSSLYYLGYCLAIEHQFNNGRRRSSSTDS